MGQIMEEGPKKSIRRTGSDVFGGTAVKRAKKKASIRLDAFDMELNGFEPMTS